MTQDKNYIASLGAGLGSFSKFKESDGISATKSWVLFKEPSLNKITIQEVSDNIPFKTIARLDWNSERMTGYEQERNARLMACAPDLVKALEEIEAMCGNDSLDTATRLDNVLAIALVYKAKAKDGA
jgi:hypothetical protein